MEKSWTLPQEVSKSDLQAMKIWPGQFLTIFHKGQFLQWKSMSVYEFSIVRNRRLFLCCCCCCCINNNKNNTITQQQRQLKFLYLVLLLDSVNQCRGSNCDLFANQYLFQKNKSWTIVKDRAKWNVHWNFNSLILSFRTWNILKKCSSQIFTACRSDLDTSWEYFVYNKSELSCWNYNGCQCRIQIPFFACVTMGHDFSRFWNKYWFANRSEFDPLHCQLKESASVELLHLVYKCHS